MAEDGRLDDDAVHQRLARLEAMLALLEETGGPTAGAALDAVQALAEVYGEALARVVARLGITSPAVRAMADDELLGHLFVLHDLHPEGTERRVAAAVESVQPYIRSHGGRLEFSGVDDGVAKVRLTGSCGSCSSAASTLENVVSEAVLASAPELSGVQALPTDGPAALIPPEALLHKPAQAATA